MSTEANPKRNKAPLRPKLPVEVAIYAAACLIEDLTAVKGRAEQVMAALQTLRRDIGKEGK